MTMPGNAGKIKAQDTRRNTLTGLLLVAILIVIVNTWVAFRSVGVLVDNERWVQHTLQVINQVELIMSAAKDAETGNRGFLITGEDTYLVPYTEAVKELPGDLNTFQTLTADNASQQARLLEMRALLEQRLSLLAQGIQRRREGSPQDEVRLLVLTGTGKLEMDHVRRVADAMEAEEQRLLTIREAAAHRSSLQARGTIGLASALDLMLLVMIFRHLGRERALRLETERVAAELAVSREAVEAKSTELTALNRELEERVRIRTAELETTNRELEAFSYSVSHDLRAPLRTIDGFSLALEEDYTEAVDATGKDYIRRVRSGVQRMGQLIDALLQLSRITRADLVREEFDMAALARSVVADLQIGTSKAGSGEMGALATSVSFVIDDGPVANGDPRLIRVALENLLGNAVKFSSKVGEPIVQFGWDDGVSAWFIRDNGAGFDMFYADRLFTAFNRLHGDKDFKGSGIGLATVARVIGRHHGRIWADSVIGSGATFWFTLG
ncbi:signal transduction histidine kinase [Granulicella aggregans]|uniref:histidine kinase n=2 Tax=Granulicella aggregans TaxID=474949 RepID=A0A7W7ZAL1_9BACT|nr:signal transduction histidine kinase [Granulicella aggregans]